MGHRHNRHPAVGPVQDPPHHPSLRHPNVFTDLPAACVLIGVDLTKRRATVAPTTSGAIARGPTVVQHGDTMDRPLLRCLSDEAVALLWGYVQLRVTWQCLPFVTSRRPVRLDSLSAYTCA